MKDAIYKFLTKNKTAVIIIILVGFVSSVYSLLSKPSTKLEESRGSIHTVNQQGNNTIVNESLLVEDPIGEVNSMNTHFKVLNKPVYVVADGTTYFEGKGYMYSNGEIIMEIPTSYDLKSFHKR